MTQSITPPPPHGPTAKEKKYDRQLRLWAASGQQALENAHILLLNSGSGVVGVETLKNLVLPGIGQFTIVDEAIVAEEDLGVNFFLEESSLGKSRAEECCRLLRELNPEVTGTAIQKSIDDFVSDTFLTPYTLILLIGPARVDTLRKTSEIAWQNHIPLFYIHSIGFYSHFSVQLPKHFPIVDTHPDPASTQDLRLLRPWPELVEYVKEQTNGMEDMNNHDHGHVPYLLLLLHYLEKWKEDHEGKPPENYKEKTAFRDMVRAAARTDNPEGGEENFDEAVAAVVKSLNPPTVPSGFNEIVVLPQCRAPVQSSANFSVIANAVHWFVCKHNNILPLPGALPDMKAQSKDYVALQNLYRSKAQADLAEVTEKVRATEKKLERPNPIDVKEIEAFCKGAAFVKLVHGRKILLPAASGDSKPEADERWQALAGKIKAENEDDEEPIPGFEPSLLGALMAFRAFDVAVDRDQAAPFPRTDDTRQQLEDALLEEVNASIGNKEQDAAVEETGGTPSAGALRERTVAVAKELARSGGAELHNISALTGGAVAQEVIKVVTKQYVPVDNTCIFDGVKSRSATFRL